MAALMLAACVWSGAEQRVVASDGFEEDLAAPWRVVSGNPLRAGNPDEPLARVLDMTPSSKVMLDIDLPRDFAVDGRVWFVEKRPWVEAPFLVRANEDGTEGIQIYLEQTGNQVIAVRYARDAVLLASAPSPVPLEIGKWYAVRIAASGQRVAVWLNGGLALTFVDRAPRPGRIGLRVGDARTYYDDIAVRALSPREAERMAGLAYPEELDPELRAIAFPLANGGEGVLECPDVARPLRRFEVCVRPGDDGTYVLRVDNRVYPLGPNCVAEVVLSGAEGEYPVEIERDGAIVATASVRLEVWTEFVAEPYSALFETLRRQVKGDRSSWTRDGRTIAANPTWVRDHIHEMKAYQFWEKDLTSFVDALIELQHPDGFFYEILGDKVHDHQTFVNPKHVLVEPEKNLSWIRLEMEADVEYLMVEAAHRIWQATGDDGAMRRRLPALERGLEYDFCDPTRWDTEHGALKRTFSIDTWDFTYGISDQNRKIEPGLPMGIMHGDNSGLYQACRQVAAMRRAIGDTDRAAFWETRAGELRERVNRLCFNGRFYTHQILLQPVDTGVDEAEILSLSNAYDINRGLPTEAMAVSILDEYRQRKDLRKDTHFAEWFSIDPPYPKFGPYAAGEYINGGICGFVAGELAKAAFDHGREDYGADILRRVADKVAQDGGIHFLYDASGKDMGGGPKGWAAAAVISAFVEGLAGIRDDAVLFREVTVSPRFPAAGIDDARVCLQYGPSGAYVALEYAHRPAARRIEFSLAGNAELYHIRVLLPVDAGDPRIVESAQPVESARVETVEQSRYFCGDVRAEDRGVLLRVEY